MKTSFAAALTLLAGALAAPSTLDTRQGATQVTFSVINDVSGANVQRTIAADGVAKTLGSLFAGTNLVQNGRVIATSAQLTTIVNGVFCNFKDGNQVPRGVLNAMTTFTELDGVKDRAVETDVTDFTFVCEQ